MASADGQWMHHLKGCLPSRAADMSDPPKTIMWETEERVAGQTFDAHAGESALVKAQPSGRQEMAQSAHQNAAAASLTWHAPDGTVPLVVCMSSPADCVPSAPQPLLKPLESSQTVIEANVLQRQRLRRVTEEAAVEEAMVDNAGTTRATTTEADAPSPKSIIAVLFEQPATRWLTSQPWRLPAAMRLNGTNEVGKDHDIECQLKAPKAEASPGRRNAEDKAKLHLRAIAWVIWLLFIVYITYIANMHMYMFIKYGCVTYYCLPL